MEHLSIIKATFLTAIGVIGSGVVNLFGGWTDDLATIIPVAAGDVITSSIYQVSGSNARIAISYTILPVMVS